MVCRVRTGNDPNFERCKGKNVFECVQEKKKNYFCRYDYL